MGKCFFCEESNEKLLDAHRLKFGGKYIRENILVVCSLCHRKVHSGLINIDERKYNNTKGVPIIHYWEDGQEYWKYEE